MIIESPYGICCFKVHDLIVTIISNYKVNFIELLVLIFKFFMSKNWKKKRGVSLVKFTPKNKQDSKTSRKKKITK
jgi:hypothetical protein